MAGGRRGVVVVVSEAHSTLIHKVGNTTPSSAVSSAFYFMGDCTVCLSVHGYASGHLLFLLTSCVKNKPSAPKCPAPLPWFPKDPYTAPLRLWPPRGPALGLVGGDSAWRQT